jgi:hypothetical protein
MFNLPGSCGFRGIYDGFSDGTAGVEGIDLRGFVIRCVNLEFVFSRPRGARSLRRGLRRPCHLGGPPVFLDLARRWSLDAGLKPHRYDGFQTAKWNRVAAMSSWNSSLQEKLSTASKILVSKSVFDSRQ